jgi:hypothetical protein
MGSDFREEYKSFPTLKLVAIATSDTTEYQAAAIEAARAELDSRGDNWQDEGTVIEARIAAGDVVTGELNIWAKIGLIIVPFWALLIGTVMALMPKYEKRGEQMLMWGGIGLLVWLGSIFAYIGVMALLGKL